MKIRSPVNKLTNLRQIFEYSTLSVAFLLQFVDFLTQYCSTAPLGASSFLGAIQLKTITA